MSLLEVKNVSFTYSKNSTLKKAAVKNISFSADKGDIIGVIGHTGSGKSTLMQMLNGLIKPDSGNVYFDGTDIWERPKEISKFRYKIGLVFQYPEYQLFEETVFKDVAYGPTNMGLTDKEIDERVRNSVNRVGLSEEYLNKSPFDLSGGEKRRAAIAGIIAMQPEVLVLDEPTAGLDPSGRENLLNMILEYRSLTNAAVIIVSHSMEDLAKIADKLLVLNNGEAAMFDSLQNVFSKSEELLKMGLDVPQITRIVLELKKQGLLDCPNVFTVEDAERVILEALGGGARNA